MKRRNVLGLLSGLPLAAWSAASRAQDSYPNRPVKIVVPFGPGRSGNIVSRIVAHELEKMAGLPYRTVKEFVAFAKALKPGDPVFSGYGNASSRVPSALFEERSGVKFEEVAYRDAVPSIQDLAAGRVHVVFPDQTVGEGYVRSGYVRAIAVTSLERSPQYPDLETIAETYPGFSVIAFLSFSLRNEVPVEIQRKLNRWVTAATHKPEVHKRLLEINATTPPADWDIEKSTDFVRNERKLWANYIKLAKIEPQ